MHENELAGKEGHLLHAAPQGEARKNDKNHMEQIGYGSGYLHMGLGCLQRWLAPDSWNLNALFSLKLPFQFVWQHPASTQTFSSIARPFLHLLFIPHSSPDPYVYPTSPDSVLHLWPHNVAVQSTGSGTDLFVLKSRLATYERCDLELVP